MRLKVYSGFQINEFVHQRSCSSQCSLPAKADHAKLLLRQDRCLPSSPSLPKANSTETGASQLFWAEHWECFRSYLPRTAPPRSLGGTFPSRRRDGRRFLLAASLPTGNYRRYKELSLLCSTTKANSYFGGFNCNIHTAIWASRTKNLMISLYCPNVHTG